MKEDACNMSAKITQLRRLFQKKNHVELLASLVVILEEILQRNYEKILENKNLLPEERLRIKQVETRVRQHAPPNLGLSHWIQIYSDAKLFDAFCPETLNGVALNRINTLRNSVVHRSYKPTDDELNRTWIAFINLLGDAGYVMPPRTTGLCAICARELSSSSLKGLGSVCSLCCKRVKFILKKLDEQEEHLANRICEIQKQKFSSEDSEDNRSYHYEKVIEQTVSGELIPIIKKCRSADFQFIYSTLRDFVNKDFNDEYGFKELFRQDLFKDLCECKLLPKEVVSRLPRLPKSRSPLDDLEILELTMNDLHDLELDTAGVDPALNLIIANEQLKISERGQVYFAMDQFLDFMDRYVRLREDIKELVEEFNDGIFSNLGKENLKEIKKRLHILLG